MLQPVYVWMLPIGCLLDKSSSRESSEGIKVSRLLGIIPGALGVSCQVSRVCHNWAGGCRYSQEQPFTALNLEIRNHQHLKESLEQYVKGDLLEGANAYYCERCGKKVGCAYSLSPSLAISPVITPLAFVLHDVNIHTINC